MIRLVKFGGGGDTVYDDDGSTTSGYGNPDRPHAAAGKDIPDGTPVVDLRAAVETAAGYSWVFAGPMLSVTLPDGEVDACPDVPAVMAGPGGLSGEFAAVAVLHAAQRAAKRPRSGLDYVGIAEWVQGWREHGARVGKYVGGAIVWE